MAQIIENSTNSREGVKAPVVMQIIPELGPGGAEQGCIDIAAELVRAGSHSIVVSHGGSRIHELNRAGATHIDLPVHSKNPMIMWRNIGRLKKLIKKHDVDIVHVRSRAPAWSAWKACMGTAARYMSTCHAPYNIGGKAKRFYNSAIAKGERVIAISNYVANYLVENYEMNQNNIRLIHRGVDLARFHPANVTPAQIIQVTSEWRLPDGANIVMLPGRLTRWKGHHVLIEAMAQLNQPDLFCVMIGSDQGREEYRAELETAIEEKNLPEGFGRIPIEAQAMGRPIVATDHGGAQETIIRGQTGWLTPPHDADALCAAIKEALSLNENEKSILAQNAMAHIAHNFTKEKMAHDTLSVYAELIEEKYGRVSSLQQAAE